MNLRQPLIICLMLIVVGGSAHGKEQQRLPLNLIREAAEAPLSGYPNPEPGQAMTGRYGIGVAIQTHENPRAQIILIVRPGSPAEQAGLKKDDEITEVDSKPMANLTTTEVAGLLTTTQEAPVLLRIRRGSNEFEVTVQRASLERIYNLPPRGKPASSFALQDTNGKTVSLEDFKGRPVIVTFWATWCGPCVAESDALNN
jgi:membrane-associated protease RseP (regulator of RpoE activity)